MIYASPYPLLAPGAMPLLLPARVPSRLPLTLGSLFTGIGGIDLAFQRAGFTISFQVEIDDYCNKVLAKHWPTVTRHKDVRAVGKSTLPTVDVLAGGFPCQDISAAGKGAGIKEGTRSGLWFEFARIIGEIRPRVVMLENVAAITSRDGTRVIADLTALGYDAEWGIIPASAAGAAHRRERWWCVAYAQSTGSGQPRYEYSSTQGQGQSNSSNRSEWRRSRIGSEVRGQTQVMDDPKIKRWDDGENSPHTWQTIRDEHPPTSASFHNATNGASQSVLGRAVDGLSRRLDGARWPAPPGQPQHTWEAPRTTSAIPDRAARLKALGNAVVPAVVQPIAEAIAAFLKAQDTEASRSTINPMWLKD